jgi:DNA mismatch repair protein MutL
MGRVIRLDDNTINQIAAGEVVERPASVVKELIENALDAGAQSVIVEMSGGGREMIRVTDDGSGMSREDALLSLERHATSKIRTIDDISTSGSLGFRGEALPSIASVSRIEIITRVSGEDTGTRILAEGGMVLSCEDVGSRPGTQVTVRDLFYNTPARLKFLRNAAAETSRAVGAAIEACLAAPGVRFTVIAEGKEIARTPGQGDLFDTIVSLYGTEFARALVEVRFDAQGVAVSGYAGRAGLSRASRREQHFQVRGRPVRDAAIRWALEEAYSGNIPRGRYPVAFLDIVTPPGDVDVNVHPAKAEVRFRDESAVRRTVLVAVSRALAGAPVGPASQEGKHSDGRQSETYREVRYQQPGGPGRGDARGWSAQPGASSQVFEEFRQRAEQQGQMDLAALEPAGQVLGTYIVAEHPGGMVLVDQHAAHERINFERIRDRVAKGHSLSQQLLLPETLEPGPAERSVLREYADTLRKFGFDIEEFGGGAWIVRSCLMVEGVQVGLQDLLDRLVREQPIAVEDWPGQRAAVALSACVASVKAGDRLDRQAQVSLLRDLALTREPSRCPHGRPTLVRFDKDDIERRFGRR